jgi:hypothetical protein
MLAYEFAWLQSRCFLVYRKGNERRCDEPRPVWLEERREGNEGREPRLGARCVEATVAAAEKEEEEEAAASFLLTNWRRRRRRRRRRRAAWGGRQRRRRGIIQSSGTSC